MSFLKDATVALLAVLITLLALEGSLRLAHERHNASLFQRERERGYALRPNAEGWNVAENEAYIRINSDGLRDRERPRQRPANTLRIAVIGSSDVEARQVALEETFETVMDRELGVALKPHQRCVDVLNFGVDGYALSQADLTLRNHVWKYDPQVVILALAAFNILRNTRDLYPGDTQHSPFFVVRDGRLEPDEQTRSEPAPDPRRLAWRNRLSDWMNRSYLLTLLNEANAKLRMRITGLRSPAVAPVTTRPKDYVQWWQYLPNLPETQEAWGIAEAFLLEMKRDCDRHGAEFWVVNVDAVMQVDPNRAVRQEFARRRGLASLDASDQRVERFSAQHGIQVLSMAPPLGEYSAAHAVALHFNEGHWNVLGHEIGGQVISQALLARSRTVQAWASGSGQVIP